LSLFFPLRRPSAHYFSRLSKLATGGMCAPVLHAVFFSFPRSLLCHFSIGFLFILKFVFSFFFFFFLPLPRHFRFSLFTVRAHNCFLLLFGVRPVKVRPKIEQRWPKSARARD
jgi:hypothetical protein